MKLSSTYSAILYTLLYRNNLRYKQIPIVINNRNRYTSLRQLVAWLESNGYENIYIIDNDSTYPPLLAYYDHCKHKVIRQKNLGHLALWKIPLFRKICWNYYVYTDSDILPVEDCRPDVLAYFLGKLQQYPRLDKIGFGLKIDDLPDHYTLKEGVIEWERGFWEKAAAPGIFEAAIDTTFALYRPFTKPREGQAYMMPAYRTGPPYVSRHLPWYEDTNNLSEEEQYYINTASVSASWTDKLKNG